VTESLIRGKKSSSSKNLGNFRNTTDFWLHSTESIRYLALQKCLVVQTETAGEHLTVAQLEQSVCLGITPWKHVRCLTAQLH